jgi:hypothetical protein
MHSLRGQPIGSRSQPRSEHDERRGRHVLLTIPLAEPRFAHSMEGVLNSALRARARKLDQFFPIPRY